MVETLLMSPDDMEQDTPGGIKLLISGIGKKIKPFLIWHEDENPSD
jgi:hypothetical protein